jgi:chromobox protein 5
MDDEELVVKKRKKNHRTKGSENQQHLEPEVDEVYVVERIIAEKLKKGGSKWYWVKWAGYDDEHNTWEPTSNLVDAADMVSDFVRERDAENAVLREQRLARAAAARAQAVADKAAADKEAEEVVLFEGSSGTGGGTGPVASVI